MSEYKMLTEDRVNEIRERIEAERDGKWQCAVIEGQYAAYRIQAHTEPEVIVEGDPGDVGNYRLVRAAIIAHACTDIADLLHERDDLRRQLTGAQADHARYVERHDKTIDWWRNAVDKVEADNAALIEALTGCGELCHADGCEGSHDWDTDDSDDCTCGATPINLTRRAALAPIRNRKEPTNG